jgi:two-component system sensor histidine kinase and response regulator WspE
MPEMDGFRLLEVLRRRSETLPVILVTARSSATDRARAEALGVSAYVTKGDFHSESLVQVVRRFLSEDM